MMHDVTQSAERGGGAAIRLFRAGSILAGLIALPVSSPWAAGAVPLSETIAVHERGKRLAQDTNRTLDRLVRPGTVVAGAIEPTDASATFPSGRLPQFIESGSDWLARTARSYAALIERLSRPTSPNPVADAARKLAAERDAFLKGARRGTTIHEMAPEVSRPVSRSVPDVRGSVVIRRGSFAAPPSATRAPEPSPEGQGGGLLGWLNRGYLAFQAEVVGKLSNRPVGAYAEAAPGLKSPEPRVVPMSEGRQPVVAAGEKLGAAAAVETAPQARHPAAAPAPTETRRVDVFRKAEIARQEAATKAVEAALRAEQEQKAAQRARMESATVAEMRRQAATADRAEARVRALEAARIAEAKAAEDARLSAMPVAADVPAHEIERPDRVTRRTVAGPDAPRHAHGPARPILRPGAIRRPGL